MPRLTRKEKQAHTRFCLMESAARVFTRRGLQQASIDEVAGDAGFTKGAFYANFKSKEELFLAMLDERFAQRIEQIDRVWSSDGDMRDKARQAGQDFAEYLSDDEWSRLFFEFAAYAARNEEFRQELVTRYRALRERVADIYSQQKEKLGIEPAVAPEQVAAMIFAMVNGLALEKLLEPDVVADDAFGTMLVAFFAGLGATREVAPTGPERSS
jgi:AcrR family transcriptional regulator